VFSDVFEVGNGVDSTNGWESNILSLTCKINVPRIFPFAVTNIS